MNFKELIASKKKTGPWIFLGLLFSIVIFSMFMANQAESDFGRVQIQQIKFKASNGKTIVAKLMIPKGVSEKTPAPGIVYLHGYQNNKETSAPYCIEAARRGFVVLNIDTLGRGQSDAQIDAEKPGFDPLYGGRDAWEYLLKLPIVDSRNSGLMGHSLGAEMVYSIAVSDDREKVLITSGFAWLDDADQKNPKNMLMIFGKYDEYRNRMSQTKDFESEWMTTNKVKKIIKKETPDFNKTYGTFSDGTARMVFMPNTTHVRESFDSDSISVAMDWLKNSLHPDSQYWINSKSQIWPIKEIFSLLALIAGVMILIPLSLILIKCSFFSGLQNNQIFKYSITIKELIKHGGINGVVMLFYLPLILVVFAIHIYLIRIDFVFPLMMVNGVLFWFLITNLLGKILFNRWLKKGKRSGFLTEADLKFSTSKNDYGKTIIFSIILFLICYLVEALGEFLFGVNYRFIFPYAGVLTPFRFILFLEYSILFYVGFIQMERFLFFQLRLKETSSWIKTWLRDSFKGIVIMILPILIILGIQYIPLFISGVVPFVGPGASLVGFVMNLEHMILLLSLIIPIGAWLYRLTGNTTAGVVLSSLIVSWFFCSSSVIAPVPI